MPNTPERGNQRGNQQPNAEELRKRQQMNDSSLQGEDEDDDEEGRIEAPGTDEDEESGPLRTEEGGETGEDEDLPDDDATQVNSNPGNFANDRERASDAGRKGGRQ
jgi:general stress protein YciG